MDGGFVPRFAVEIAFLGLLALAAGLAELAPPWIVAVMAAGWLLVTLIEWLAWRSEMEQAAAGAGLHPPAQADEAPTDGWDLDDILAPLPEGDEPGREALPSEELPRGDGR